MLSCLFFFHWCFSLFWGHLDEERLCWNQQILLDVWNCLRVGAPCQSSEPSSFSSLQTLILSQKSAFNSSDGFVTLECNSISHKYIFCHTQNKPPSPDPAMICAGVHYYRSVLCLFSSEAIMCIILNCPVSYLNAPSKWNEIALLIWLHFSFPRWLVYMSAVTSLCYYDNHSLFS